MGKAFFEFASLLSIHLLRTVNGILFGLCCLIFGAQYAQPNLVPNASFEVYSSCPSGSGQFDLALPWFNPNTASPDLFNQCSPVITSVNVPYGIQGFQYSKVGLGHAGIFVFANGNSKEYIETRLLQTLLQGRKYCIEFYVNLCNVSKYATSSFGAYFSNDSLINANNAIFFNVLPQVENGTSNVPLDTLNWIVISGSFVAQGDENFVTIGCFRADANMVFDSTSWGGDSRSYYYIDDVSVTLCEDSTDSEFFIPTAFSPNADGNNDILHVRGPIKGMDFYIYDRWGELVYHGTDPKAGWDGTYNGQYLNPAVFVYYFRGTLLDGTPVTQKGEISLIR